MLLGMLQTEEVVLQAKQKNFSAIGLTDEGNMFGAMEFALAAAKHGIKPIMGSVLTLRHQGEEGDVTLFARNEEGWKQLVRLVSYSFLNNRSDAAHITAEMLEGTSGLIVCSGGRSGILTNLYKQNKQDEALLLASHLKKLLPERFYLEVCRHQEPGEDQQNSSITEIAAEVGLPLVVAQDCYYSSALKQASHKTLLRIRQSNRGSGGKAKVEEESLPMDGIYDLKPADEMAKLFADLPDALENAAIIAQRASFLLTAATKQRLPKMPYPEGEDAALRTKAEQGLAKLLKTIDQARPPEDYQTRLEYELGVIKKVGFSGYFLIVAQIVNWAKQQNIPVGPGRGSGAGSLVSYAIGITGLDPLKYGLLFERFLNPERVSMPDFDIDLCESRRDEVIDYIKQTYGEENVAQIVTFAQLKPRQALKDVGRAQGIPFKQMNEIAKMVPFDPIDPYTIKRTLEEVKEFKQFSKTAEGKAMVEVASDLENLHRHASTHAAGVVISDSPLVDMVPLYADKNVAQATQFSMANAEAAGLVKFDFLGLKTLTVIANAMKAAGLAEIPHTQDVATYKLLAAADTIGVFQLESGGMRDVLKRLKPDRFGDIIAVISLYRPGPMDNIPSYINRKNGTEQIASIDASFDDILAETYGIPIYQEQVMQIAQAFSGFSLAKADVLRKAMGKKDAKVMAALKEDFTNGATARGKPKELAERVFKMVEKFAGYGFNKSHAAGYAVLSYQTAWLKSHHPAAFYMALLNQAIGDTEKVAMLRKDAKRHKVEVVYPDINLSSVQFSIAQGRVIHGLTAIRDVGESAAKAIVAERQSGGAYQSFVDFSNRILKGFNKRCLEALAKAGCFDSLCGTEPSGKPPENGEASPKPTANGATDPKKATEKANNKANKIGEYRASCLAVANEGDNWLAQGKGLFDESPMPKAEPLTQKQMLNGEYAHLGFYRTAHPLPTAKQANGQGLAGSDQIEETAADKPLTLRGYVVAVEKRTINGKQAAFVTLSDGDGQYEASLFGNTYQQAEHLLQQDAELRLTGRITRTKTHTRFNVNRVDLAESDPTAFSGSPTSTSPSSTSPSSTSPTSTVPADLPANGSPHSLAKPTATIVVEIATPKSLAEVQALASLKELMEDYRVPANGSSVALKLAETGVVLNLPHQYRIGSTDRLKNHHKVQSVTVN